MPCRLIAYYRVSTDKQGRSGLGLEAQEFAVGGYSKQTGCTVVASYTEIESGKNSARPELAKAMAHAKRIGATLVIAKLDRLSRNVYFLSGLMEGAVDFVCCDNPSATRLTLHILAAVAEDEVRRISERTTVSLAAAKARGVKLGGVRPGQHTLTDADRAKGCSLGGAKAALGKRKAALDACADVLPIIEELRGQSLSLAAIAQHLNEKGLKTRTGAAWGAVQVKRVLDRVAPVQTV